MHSFKIKQISKDSQNSDFAKRIKDLGANLQSRNDEMQDYFNQINKVDAIKNVIVAYVNNQAVGCGAVKQFDNNTVEAKSISPTKWFENCPVRATVLYQQFSECTYRCTFF